MKTKQNKKIKFIFSLFVAFLLLFSQPGLVSAQLSPMDPVVIPDLLGVGSPGEFLEEILNYFNVDEETFEENIETFNSSSKKKTPPQVSLFFSPTSPKEGEEITVTASPTYFKNDPKDLYYTWFLKGADCTDREIDGSKYKYNSKCDLDDNNKVDIEDYKIRAAQIIANGGFVYKSANYKEGGDDDGYEAPSGGNDQEGKNAYCYVHDHNTGEQDEINCGSTNRGTRHLFPNAPGEVTGDDDFGRDEEEFWHTDPTSTDTANLGNVDEANVAGLGVRSFSWNYQKGDKVGVAIEGVSTDSVTDYSSSDDYDASFKTMWAISNKNYSEDSDGDIDKVSDLDDLLYDALVAPAENNAGSNKLNINLSYSPDSPINDPAGIDSDTLIISSYISNAEDINYLKYDWSVYASNDIHPREWGDGNSPPIPKSKLPDSTLSIGLGLDTFKFKLALEDSLNSGAFNYKYLRILLTVEENVGEDNPRLNAKDIIIPITSSTGDQINAHTVNVVDDSSNSAGVNLSQGEKICNRVASEKAICPVIKNQIIGLSISEDNFPPGTSSFLWTVDGKPLNSADCYFDGCKEDRQTNKAFFPILKEIGEQYAITLTATNTTNGEKTTLTKFFKVVEPSIEIVSDNKNVCANLPIGQFTDEEGVVRWDYSESDFWANICADIRLKVSPPGQYTWNVDGKTINTSESATAAGFNLNENSGVLTLPPKKNLEESYSIITSTIYTQSNLTKKALKNIWGVSRSQYYEKVVSDDATITMVECDDSNYCLDQNSNKKIFATVFSSTPTYLAFLLRIVITIAIILFTAKLIFSFTPNIDSEEH